MFAIEVEEIRRKIIIVDDVDASTVKEATELVRSRVNDGTITFDSPEVKVKSEFIIRPSNLLGKNSDDVIDTSRYQHLINTHYLKFDGNFYNIRRNRKRMTYDFRAFSTRFAIDGFMPLAATNNLHTVMGFLQNIIGGYVPNSKAEKISQEEFLSIAPINVWNTPWCCGNLIHTTVVRTDRGDFTVTYRGYKIKEEE